MMGDVRWGGVADEAVLHMFNRAGVMEHGGNVGGSWLTDFGRHCYGVFEENGWPGREDDFKEGV